jgi:hypothetical protein
MQPVKDFLANWDEFRAQFGNELRLGACIVLVVLISAVMRSGGGEPAPAPEKQQRNPMELVASPNDPLMIEAIRIAQAPSGGRGPWGATPIAKGPRATFQTPGGPITLTQTEIADANHLYPQLKSNPAILRGNRSGRSSNSQSGSFSEDLSGNW